MRCCGERDREEKILETQKWDYINLSDFRSTSCIPPLSYVILWIALFISIACYVVDLFTASQLLIFDRWGGKIAPVVPLSISRWIFLGCIVASWVFLGYRWWRAVRAMKSGGIAQSYLDPLAVRIQSIRMGREGRGWRRFLVFAEMTKGKKGADYVALFTYFSFEAWYRIIFAEGPRNAINAMTLWSILQTNLLPNGQNKNLSPVMQFFTNVKILADGDKIRAAVLFGMLFVLITWVLAALSLILSCIFYITFLWHHIPSTDRSLRAYCKRKVDSRLTTIVDQKVSKALVKADAKRARQDLREGRDGESIADIKRQPTLPVLSPTSGDMLPAMPLSRQDTLTSQSVYATDLERQPTLPSFEPSSRPYIQRHETSASAASFHSYNSDAPLMDQAGPMGNAPPRSYSPALRSYSPAPPRPYTPGQQPRPFNRIDSNLSNSGSGNLISPLSPGESFAPYAPHRSNTGTSNMQPRRNPGSGNHPQGRNSPALGYRPNQMQEFEMRAQTPGGFSNRANTSSPFGYHQGTSNSQSFRSPVQRSFTSPMYSSNGPPRSTTPALRGPGPRSDPRGGYDQSYDPSIYDHY